MIILMKTKMQEIDEKSNKSFESLCNMHNEICEISKKSTEIMNKLCINRKIANEALNESMRIADKLDEYTLNTSMIFQRKYDEYIKSHTKEEATALAHKDIEQENQQISAMRKEQEEARQKYHRISEEDKQYNQEHIKISEILKGAQNKYNDAYEEDKELRNTRDNLRAQLNEKRERDLLIGGLFAAILIMALVITTCKYTYPIPKI